MRSGCLRPLLHLPQGQACGQGNLSRRGKETSVVSQQELPAAPSALDEAREGPRAIQISKTAGLESCDFRMEHGCEGRVVEARAECRTKERTMDSFTSTSRPVRVVFGHGTLDRLSAEVEHYWGEARLDPDYAAPGGRGQGARETHRYGLSRASAGAAIHTPVEVTEKAMAELREARADCVIALGGGLTHRCRQGARRGQLGRPGSGRD